MLRARTFRLVNLSSARYAHAYERARNFLRPGYTLNRVISDHLETKNVE